MRVCVGFTKLVDVCTYQHGGIWAGAGSRKVRAVMHSWRSTGSTSQRDCASLQIYRDRYRSSVCTCKQRIHSFVVSDRLSKQRIQVQGWPIWVWVVHGGYRISFTSWAAADCQSQHPVAKSLIFHHIQQFQATRNPDALLLLVPSIYRHFQRWRSDTILAQMSFVGLHVSSLGYL